MAEVAQKSEMPWNQYTAGGDRLVVSCGENARSCKIALGDERTFFAETDHCH